MPRRPPARRFSGLEPAHRFGYLTEERDGEHQPPDADAREREPDGGSGVGNAEPGRPLDHQQVDREQHAAAEIADRVAGRRHPIELLLADQMGEERLVEYDAAGDGDIADDEQDERKRPVARHESSTSTSWRPRRCRRTCRASSSSSPRSRRWRRGAAPPARRSRWPASSPRQTGSSTGCRRGRPRPRYGSRWERPQR